jgi:hypothetical protein
LRRIVTGHRGNRKKAYSLTTRESETILHRIVWEISE